MSDNSTGTSGTMKRIPVPPPRRKKLSQSKTQSVLKEPITPKNSAAQVLDGQGSSTNSMLPVLTKAKGTPEMPLKPKAVPPDSGSISSSEEETDAYRKTPMVVQRSSTVILDRARKRLSMVSLSHMFTPFMSADKKLQSRIVELARNSDSYFGNLVQDYKNFTVETMHKHISSTEMLQEIRQMMTQLKSYLIQSSELQTLEISMYPDGKLEAIIEAALYKSVLKPLREAVYVRLQDLHTQDQSLKKLCKNQQVVQGLTPSDLGVATSVPDGADMERIQLRLVDLHNEYSPEKKISLLLKTCKIIYEAMAVGSSGRAHGADDFLPVLMYVLTHSNISALMLDVEYMMELMDPALQLGEGSYYLITTYGAVEHIKNYDIMPITRHLSLQVQDSIHRWEKRRTLNRERATGSSLQDFITVSFLEVGCNTKTLPVQPKNTTLDVCSQCAEKFEVTDATSYRLHVQVEGNCRPLAPDELPLSVKSSLHNSQHRGEYFFVFQPGN